MYDLICGTQCTDEKEADSEMNAVVKTRNGAIKAYTDWLEDI